ncbi:hypothetical protein IRJ41_009451 [Triplophysa rosa]|uniref:Uncharacterized protein n=1 Tax=Triplophysa rosa TaxID=992332 RepID=A0A9W7T9H9_TRIRA|nr:hypothetical protein IRJ41_009451 [Triplophysa rosa]
MWVLRTYYETLRRKYSLCRPGKSQLRDSIKAGAKTDKGKDDCWSPRPGSFKQMQRENCGRLQSWN